MIERRKILALPLIIGFASYFGGCETLGIADRQPSASLRTDSAEIGVHKSGNAYLAKIGFLYVNTTSQQ